MKKRYIFLILTVILVFLFAFTTSYENTSADAGGFRGGHSYSSSGSHGSSRSYSSNRSSGSSYSGGSFYIFPFPGIYSRLGYILIIIFVAWVILKTKRSVKTVKDDILDIGDDYSPDIESFNRLLEKDPNFSEADFQEKVARVYNEMQYCWTKGDFEPMRAYLSSQLFNQLNNQLKELKSKGYTNYIDNIAVLDVRLIKYSEDNKYQYIYCVVKSRINDYTLDRFGNAVAGDKNQEVFMTYGYTLLRNVSATTTEEPKKTHADKCPNCGAPIELNSSGRCEYCGSIISATEYDWIINSIKGLEQING